MASDVEICNMALSHLGADATVASIDPPEGSAQAEHCARFFPIARDSLLEMPDAAWRFATRRAQLAQLTCDWEAWDYAYAIPADLLRVIAVMPSDADDDYVAVSQTGSAELVTSSVPQPYTVEINDDGALVIYTDQENAIVRYTALVSDTARFSPLFVMALSWHLAGLLAGQVIKGDAGAAEAKRCAAMMQAYLAKAAASDARQHMARPAHSVGWIAGR